MASLDPKTRERVRYHLGYLQVQPSASLQFGIPRPIETSFLIEDAMSNLIDESVPRVNDLLSTLDLIECKLKQALNFLPAVRVGNTQVRQDHPQALELEYNRWAQRLADVFGVPMYPYSKRSQEAAGDSGSIPVRR